MVVKGYLFSWTIRPSSVPATLSPAPVCGRTLVARALSTLRIVSMVYTVRPLAILGGWIEMTAPQDSDELPAEEEMVTETEILEGALPFSEYAKDTKKLRAQIEQLEKMYDEREKVIDRILTYGSGVESNKALRMYPTSTLKKWDESLESYRASKRKKR